MLSQSVRYAKAYQQTLAMKQVPKFAVASVVAEWSIVSAAPEPDLPMAALPTALTLAEG